VCRSEEGEPWDLVPVIVPAYATYEDGTDRVFRNVGM
jgi:hypothetical protein